MLLQAHFSVVADVSMYVPYYNNGQRKSITATNNRAVLLITDDILLFITKYMF